MALELIVKKNRIILSYSKKSNDDYITFFHELPHPYSITLPKYEFLFFTYYVGIAALELKLLDRAKTVLHNNHLYFNAETSEVFDYKKKSFVSVAQLCKQLKESREMYTQSWNMYKPRYLEDMLNKIVSELNSKVKLAYLGKIECEEPVSMFIAKAKPFTGLIACQIETNSYKCNAVGITSNGLLKLIEALTRHREINLILFLLNA